MAGGAPRHVLELAEHLEAGEPAADDREGEQAAALGEVGRRGGGVEAGQDVLAQGERVGHRAERQRAVVEPGDRQAARGRAGRDHEDVVGELAGAAVGQADHHAAAGVVDRGDRPGDHVAAAQDPAQRHGEVARLDRAGRRLGQERLVGHVRLRVDHRDAGDARARVAGAEVAPAARAAGQPRLQRPRRDETRVAAPDDDHARRPRRRRRDAPAAQPGEEDQRDDAEEAAERRPRPTPAARRTPTAAPRPPGR